MQRQAAFIERQLELRELRHDAAIRVQKLARGFLTRHRGGPLPPRTRALHTDTSHTSHTPPPDAPDAAHASKAAAVAGSAAVSISAGDAAGGAGGCGDAWGEEGESCLDAPLLTVAGTPAHARSPPAATPLPALLRGIKAEAAGSCGEAALARARKGPSAEAVARPDGRTGWLRLALRTLEERPCRPHERPRHAH